MIIKMGLPKLERKYSQVMSDITNCCNAQCKFCLNEWDSISSNIFMTKTNFLKLIQILPYTNQFLYSCLFEPSIHPEFINFLKEIEPIYRKKVAFTTNLVKKYTDEEIEFLVNSNLSIINISLETFDKVLYEEITRVKNTCFYDNLNRFSMICNQFDEPTMPYFITMVLKDNFNELISIAKKAKEMFNNIKLHEFRTPYYSPEVGAYTKTQLLSKSTLETLEQQMNLLKTQADWNHITMHLIHSQEYWNFLDSNEAYRGYDTVSLFDKIANDPFHLRVSSDGTILFDGIGESINLDEIDTPSEFFASKLLEIQSMLANKYCLSEPTFDYKADLCKKHLSYYFLDLCVNYDDHFLEINGWSVLIYHNMYEVKHYIMAEINDKKFFYETKRCERQDVANHFAKATHFTKWGFRPATFIASGFSCIIDLTQNFMQENCSITFYILSLKSDNILASEWLCDLEYDGSSWEIIRKNNMSTNDN